MYEWHDILGNIFEVGDVVAYASMSYRTSHLVVAEVLSINEFNKQNQPNIKTVYNSKTGVYESIPFPTLTVKRINSSYEARKSTISEAVKQLVKLPGKPADYEAKFPKNV